MIAVRTFDAFVSRPNWVPDVIEHRLLDFYALLPKLNIRANTIGRTDVPLQTPFEDVRRLMKKCQCSIILGLPQIFIRDGSIKQADVKTNLATEWNHIEATVALMMNLPTLVLLHKTVAPRGIFERGAANLFVHDFDVLQPDWIAKVKVGLEALKGAVDV